MDERTRAATYEDVRHVAALLDEEKVEYALIGGYALALQGVVRTTEDIDILVEPTEENARRWVQALSKLPDGARGRTCCRFEGASRESASSGSRGSSA